MTNAHIFFDPLTQVPVDQKGNQKLHVSSSTEYTHVVQHSPKEFSPQGGMQPPQGPHLIYQFPSHVNVSLASDNSLEQEDQRANEEDRKAKNEKLRSTGRLLTCENSTLLFTGKRGSLIFCCKSYLQSCSLFFFPGKNINKNTQEHQLTSLSVRVHTITPTTQRDFHSLCRALDSIVQGVSNGYTRRLLLGGVGNKVSAEGQTLVFSTGLSHSLSVQLPPSLKVVCETPVQFSLYGVNKEEVSQWASRLRYHIFRKNVYAKPLLQFEGEDVSRKETRKK